MVRTIIIEPKMIVLICDFDCFNVRIKTSNQDTFERAWGGGVNGTQHVVIGAERAAQGRVERPGKTGLSVVVLKLIFDCFDFRFRTSNQDTFGRA